MNTGTVGNALTQLTRYLFVENQRLEKEDREKKINLAAQQIASRFQSLPPDATQQEIQQAEFRAIEDAASLGALQENQSLIGSLFQSRSQTRQLTKFEAQDKVLSDIVGETFGVDAQGLSGGQSLQLASTINQATLHPQMRDATGRTYMTTIGPDGKEQTERRYLLDATTYEDQLSRAKEQAIFGANLQFETQKKIARFQTDEKIRLNKELRKTQFGPLAYGIGKDGSIPTGVVQPMKGYQTPDGQPLYISKANGLPMILTKDGYRYYMGQQVKSQSVGGDQHDIYTAITDAKNYFEGEQKRIVLGIVGVKSPEDGIAGKDLITDLLKLDSGTNLTVQASDTNIDILNSQVLPVLDTFFNRDPKDIQKDVKALLVDKGLINEQGVVENPADAQFVTNFIQAVGQLQVLGQGKLSQQKSLMKNLPDYGTQNISLYDWNNGVESLNHITQNQDAISDSVIAALNGTINNMLGLPKDNQQPLSMDTFRNLHVTQQIPLIKTLSDVTTYYGPIDANQQNKNQAPTQPDYLKLSPAH